MANNSNTSSSSLASAISSFVTGSSKFLVPGRVVAANGIPQGAMTPEIDPSTLVGQPDVQQLSVETNAFGTIDLDTTSKQIWCKESHWVRALRLSDDCHSYNVQLKLQPSHRIYTGLSNTGPVPKLLLQAVRPVEAGRELLLWFSEEILAMLQVVFLRPINIQGQKKYVCTRCSALYESPNPLKLHITLSCGKYEINTLWERLSNLMKENPLDNILKQENFDFKLCPEPEVTKQRNALDLSLSSAPQTLKNLYRPYTTGSAFKPFQKDSHSERAVREVPAIWPVSLETDMMQIHQNILINHENYQTFTDEAQIESLVSSLGKAKQGHICLYCGKCYSRKYGLKIHIRTHTGYKPLKCKFCSRPFGDPSNLNKHVRLHAEGNTPYKCDLCGKILVRRRDLDRHLKSRHMIEMHPDVNILPDSSNADDTENNSDEESCNATTITS